MPYTPISATRNPFHSAADLLVLPTVPGGFPPTLQEAMGCRTPAVVSDATASRWQETARVPLHESLAPDETGLRWRASIEELLSRPDALLGELRPRLVACARSTRSWKRTVERHGEMLAHAAQFE